MSRRPKRSSPDAQKTKHYPDFPLTLHKGSGQWCKKIRGKIHYFGKDADSALLKYLDERDDLQAGRTPRSGNENGCSLADLCNQFLTAKQNRVDSDELSPLTFQEYHRTCKVLVERFGKNRLVSDIGPIDFEQFRSELAKTRNATSVGDAVRRVRMVFKFAYDNELIEQPVRYGQAFQPPSKRALRRARQEHQQKHGYRMLEAAELQIILKKCSPQMKAIVLLGINCGLGQADCSNLRFSNLDLDSGWLDFPRPKTAVERRCPLWQETVAAIKSAVDVRPEPRDDADSQNVFITAQGHRWVRATEKSRSDLVASQFNRILRGLDLKREGLNFYALRHTFETIAGDSKDQVAVDHIMGHSRDDMASVYRERIEDERLMAVTSHVRIWLFGGGKQDSDRD